MSVGPTGMAGSIAGSHLQQTKGTDVEKAQQDTANQSRGAESSSKAESAAGIGETEQDEKASDRDADGHKLWEAQPEQSEQDQPDLEPQPPAKSKDPTGESGNQLDVSG